MNLAAIYHRPESEMAFLYDSQTMHIRLRTAKDDVKAVQLLHGDPYSLRSLAGIKPPFYTKPTPMKKILSDDLYDYWQIAVTEPKKRLAYAFDITGTDGTRTVYTDRGYLQPDDHAALNDLNTYFRMPFFQEIDMFHAPEWVKKTVWYQIFPERFANGDQSNDPAGTKNGMPMTILVVRISMAVTCRVYWTTLTTFKHWVSMGSTLTRFLKPLLTISMIQKTITRLTLTLVTPPYLRKWLPRLTSGGLR